ncbi:unnamed protein product [Adineta ricciae]|uniref:Rab-GAP TBC domain-containing protein n=1 Tax=Adineta ricciae TaxID=249248 RepID=A0A814U9K0_ADIRI|nr:unnamed protein product [Adineta ricciae]
MSTTVTPTPTPTTTPDNDIERPAFRPQRPPPPPPSSSITVQSEPISPNTLYPILADCESDFTNIDPRNETPSEENRPTLLRFAFTDLFDSFNYESVRNQILTREMKTSPFTTVLWRIFLHCLPRSSSQWNQAIELSRDTYDELVNDYFLDLKKIRDHNGDVEHLNHPLSQEENSLWNQYYVYEELKENIYQDVIRTCQDIDFFRQKHILDLLLKILYIHSRHNSQSCPYRQGMHEILAVIVYTIHLESQVINEYPESNEMMKKLYDPQYLAHDAYAIYEKIMDHLQPFYDFKTNNPIVRRNAHLSDNKQILFPRSNDTQLYWNDTVMRVNTIYERLKECDRPLYEQLQDLSIEPTVYGIRWLRLLFGREIPFGSVPTLWTVIFCYDECFAFVDYFFLALLMEIGQLFKKNDISEYSFCLQYLMQPNNISDIEVVIQQALTLEKLTKTKEAQRLSANLSAQNSTGNRSPMGGVQKSASPIQNFSQNPLIDATKPSVPTPSFFSSLQGGKNNSSKTPIESEMNDNPGKESQILYDSNVFIQKYCAEFMNKFITRIKDRLCNLPDTKEDVIIQLTGLEQIANVLDGTLTFDDNSLQALANYKTKETSVPNNDQNDAS